MDHDQDIAEAKAAVYDLAAELTTQFCAIARADAILEAAQPGEERFAIAKARAALSVALPQPEEPRG